MQDAQDETDQTEFELLPLLKFQDMGVLGTSYRDLGSQPLLHSIAIMSEIYSAIIQ